MPLKVALQMDSPEHIDIDADSSFVLGCEALERGHMLFYYEAPALNLVEGDLRARLQKMTFRRKKGDHVSLSPPEEGSLCEMDVILMRQDPPFDMGYITASHLLDHMPAKSLVVNNPASVRDMPEKLCVTFFPDLMPPTLITSEQARIEEFRKKHGALVLKPLYGNGGAGIVKLERDSPNIGALLDIYKAGNMLPVIAQRFLPEIAQGDKRIILIDGKPAGAFDRFAPSGTVRANMHVGGTVKPASLNARDREICERIGPLLHERGIIFAGIDVIGGFLTEINSTSPTGLQEVNRFDNKKLEAEIWDSIEGHLARRRGQ